MRERKVTEDVLRLRTLGGVSLARGGQRLSEFLAGSKRVALLIYLALGDPEQVYERDEIMALFWPEKSEEKARAALRQQLHVLRRDLGPDLIASEGSRIRLAHGVLQCDVRTLESRLAEGQLAEALNEYRGDFLKGFYVPGAPDFEEWAAGLARRVRDKAAGAGRRLAAAHRDEGDLPAAVRSLRRVLEIAPYDQRSLRALMELLMTAGENGQAILEYEAFADRLANDLDTHPAPETAALLSQARVGAERDRPREPLSSPTPRSRTGQLPDFDDRERVSSAPVPADRSIPPSPVAQDAGMSSSSTGRPSWSRRGWWSGIAVSAFVLSGVVMQNGETSRNAPASAAIRLVVAPLEDLGPTDSAYFAAGLTDELVSRLAAVPGLEVVSAVHRDGSLPDGDPRALASELDARYVVAGSVRREPAGSSPDRVRVLARVVRADDGVEVWGEIYESYLDDIFDVQSRIAQAVTEAVGLELVDATIAPVPPTRNPEAYTFYLRGWDFLRREWIAEPLRLAMDMFSRATSLDPSFAAAWAGLSLAGSELYMAGWAEEDVRDQAIAAATRALDLDPEDPYGNLAMAMVHYRIHLDYEAADRYLEIADASMPGDPEILLAWAYVSRRKGAWQRSIGLHRRVLEREPLVSRGRSGLAWTFVHLRRYREADRVLTEALELFPDRRGFHGTRAMVHLIGWGDTERARQILAEAMGRLAASPVGYDWFALEMFDRRFEAALGALPDDPGEPQLDRGFVHGLLGDPRAAAAALDSARTHFEGRLALFPDRNRTNHPERARLLSFLALAYAGLGMERAALEAGRTAMEILPVSRDALEGPRLVERVARAHSLLGRNQTAVELLAAIVEDHPSEASRHTLRLDPRYDDLRGDPAFEALVGNGTSEAGEGR